jgi:hypothetical protein
MNPIGNQGARKRGNDAFYGQDSGTRFSEQARDEIEHGDEGAGHKGHSVDIAQQYAQSEADEYTEQAERMARDMERKNIPLGQARDEFVEGLAELLRGKPARPAQPQEEQEEPAISKSADDKFWSDPEEVKRAGKAVRPPKL